MPAFSFSQLRELNSNVRRMLQLAWRMNSKVTGRYYATIALSALGPPATGLTLKVLIDAVLVPSDRPVGIGILAAVVLAAHYLLLSLSSLLRFGLNEQYYDYLFRYELQNETAYRFCEKLTQLDVQHFEDPKVQNLITKTRDTHLWRVPDFLRFLGYLIFQTVSLAASAIALLPFGAWIPPFVIAMTVPRLLLRMKLGDLQWSMYGSGAPQARKLWYFGWLLSESTALREMKIFRTAPALLHKYRSMQAEVYELSRQPLETAKRLTLAAPLIEGTAVFAVAYSRLHAVQTGAMTVGAFAFLITMLQQMLVSAGAAAVNAAQVYENNLYVSGFFELLGLPRLIVERENPIRMQQGSAPPRIEFENVSFSYPGGREAVRDVSLTIEPGQRVALVGINGAGKSTLIKLLCRFYDTTSGRILINGVDVRDLKLSDWHQHVGTLFQDFVRYRMTVRENILFGGSRHEVDEKAVRAAAAKAGAADFIEALPGRYEQMLGPEFENGTDLSGGQWQKLAIARAFYHAAPVLIMDEPTSAIDAEAEYEIFNTLEREHDGKTLILVSHRFSTVRNADRILVVDGGRVVEDGTHDTLMAANGKYAAMFQYQAAGYR